MMKNCEPLYRFNLIVELGSRILISIEAFFV